MNGFGSPVRRAVGVVALAVACASCSALDVSALSGSGAVVSESYDVTFEFASVLNLPAGAQVMMDGTRVGTVADVVVSSTQVDVGTRIDNGILIPADARALLQQDTILGDIYVAVVRDGSTRASAVEPGGTIPLAQTSSPPQLEDTLAVLAGFVASGSIQRIQNTVSGINSATPGSTERVRALAANTATDMAELAGNIDQVDTWLTGLSDTTGVLAENSPTFDYYMSPAGQLAWDRATFSSTYVSTVLPSIGSIYEGGFWLVPMLESVGAALGSVETPIEDIVADVPAWQDLVARNIVPFMQDPAVDITSITGPDGRELIGDTDMILRMLGAMP